MGDFLSDLDEVGSYRRGGRCNAGTVYVRLQRESPDAAKAFAQKIRQENLDLVAFVAVCREHGFDISKSVVTRHRRRECRCVEELDI